MKSAAILLRPEADGPAMTGSFARHLPDEEEQYRTFRYEVIRLWQLPPAVFLAGGAGLAPLATAAAVSRADLPEVVRQARQRIRETSPAGEYEDVVAAAALVMGLRYDTDVTALMREVREMEVSSVYQEIVRIGEARGRVKELHEMILDMGRIKFGRPSRAIKQRLAEIEDRDRLAALARQLIQVDTWDKLFEE